MSTQDHFIITSNGADGACTAAMCLIKMPKAQVVTTSKQRIVSTLDDIIQQDTHPKNIHICGVGVSNDNFESITAALRVLKKRRVQVYWYCGRNYLDEYQKTLHTACKPVFRECRSNTEAVFLHHKIRSTDRTDLLLSLADEFINEKKKRPDKHQFLHDLINASSARYFKYGDTASYIQTIQKLANLIPITESDRRLVDQYRQEEKHLLPLGNSKAMKRLRQQVKCLGPIDEPVLVLGPTGSGKEIAARLLHETSKRPGQFIAINCAILSTNADLAHDRLFGHVSGAYTGAADSQPGAFEKANGGTLFLDEIAELPLSVQTQLLRVLEEETVTPLGTMDSCTVDVRIVAATHQDLPAMIDECRFRLDLYHRLNVLTLRIPSLQERREDMKSIASSMVFGLDKKGYPLKLSRADWQAIHDYSWPGNIRQFINILKRAAYMNMSVRNVLEEEIENTKQGLASISSEMLSEFKTFRPSDPSEVLPESDISRSYMKHVLALFDGNLSKAAKALKIAKNTLIKWSSE